MALETVAGSLLFIPCSWRGAFRKYMPRVNHANRLLGSYAVKCHGKCSFHTFHARFIGSLGLKWEGIVCIRIEVEEDYYFSLACCGRGICWVVASYLLSGCQLFVEWVPVQAELGSWNKVQIFLRWVLSGVLLSVSISNFIWVSLSICFLTEKYDEIWSIDILLLFYPG